MTPDRSSDHEGRGWFAHLDSTQFEELCFALLEDLGAVDVSWRKGTGGAGSPADGGRDIECDFTQRGPDGTEYKDHWLVEAKHYSSGVPARELQAVLAAAMAERPNAVLVICSGFLTNPAKDYLAQYRSKNNPPFRIRVWERPKLQRLLESRSRLLTRFGFADDLVFLRQLHPLHVEYLRDPRGNTTEHLFAILDELPPAERDDCLSMVFHFVVRPRFRRPTHENETLAEMMVDRVDYPSFKRACLGIDASPLFLTRAIVSYTLDWLLLFADETREDELRDNYIWFIEYARARLASEDTSPQDRRVLPKMIKSNEEWLVGLPQRMEEARKRYEFFCECVLVQLLEEKFPIPESVEDFEFVD